MSTTVFDDDRIVAATTVTFDLSATLDGVTWDLTGATVTLILLSPSGTSSTKSATIDDAGAGSAYYTALTTDMTAEGRWSRAWRVVQGSTDLRSLPIPFNVVASP